MLPSVLLDPALLAIPPAVDTAKEVDAIIGKVLEWSNATCKRGLIPIALMSDTTDVLGAANCFPDVPNIRALLEMHSLQGVYTAQDVAQKMNQIFAHALYALDVIGCEVRAHNGLAVDPDAFSGYELPLKDAAERAAASLLLSEKARKMPSGTNILASAAVEGPKVTVTVNGAVDESDWGGNTSHMELPYQLHGPLDIMSSYWAILDRLSSSSVWKDATRGSYAHLAIALECLRLQRVSSPNATIRQVPNFTLGSEFFSSAAKCGATGSGAFADVVRLACARVVLAPNGSDVGYLERKGASKGSGYNRIVRDDGAVARRVHVTKSGPGLRLMFWHNPAKGILELANIGPKNELEIEYGAAAGCISGKW